MKGLLVSIAVAGSLAAIPVSNALWGKAHVPLNKVQVCHKGTVRTVSKNALGGHERHGDCQLPACDFNNVFMSGGSCDGEDSSDGKCLLPFPRDEAETDACPAGTF